MKDEPVMEEIDKIFGDKFDQLQLGLQGIFSAYS
jgi:hypothetical protein